MSRDSPVTNLGNSLQFGFVIQQESDVEGFPDINTLKLAMARTIFVLKNVESKPNKIGQIIQKQSFWVYTSQAW